MHVTWSLVTVLSFLIDFIVVLTKLAEFSFISFTEKQNTIQGWLLNRQQEDKFMTAEKLLSISYSPDIQEQERTAGWK